MTIIICSFLALTLSCSGLFAQRATDSLATARGDSLLALIISARDSVKKYTSKLRETYQVEHGDIGWLASIDVEMDELTEAGYQLITTWQAYLKRADLPKSLTIGTSFIYDNGQLFDFLAFERSIDSYIDLTLSIPWLSQYLKKDNIQFELRFVNVRSLSDHATQRFIQEMNDKGKSNLVRSIQHLLSGSVLLIVDEGDNYSRWLILPDKRMVLWHFTGDTVLSWSKNDLNTSSYEYHTSAGAVVNPDGTLAGVP